MENYERELDEMEENIMNEKGDVKTERVDDIRKDIRELRIHYEQLMDLGQELEENENHFFQPENLRYFRLFCNQDFGTYRPDCVTIRYRFVKFTSRIWI